MPSISFFLKGTGAILMLHAAYSCMHYRSILQDMDLIADASSTTTEGAGSSDSLSSSTDTTTTTMMMIPPVDVYLEVVLAFALLLFGELIGMGPMQSVELVATDSSTTTSSSTKRKALAAPAYRTRDFDIYSNRSKVLPAMKSE